MALTPEQIKKILVLQKEELNGYYIYLKLSEVIKDKHNTQILKTIAQEELKHYQIWKRYTGTDINPNRLRVRFYY